MSSISKNELFEKSWKRAVNGGQAGFIAMSGQVFSMMWIRTIINHQYRNGDLFLSTARQLYKEGGIPRFYRGLPFALMQAPLSRFGDTAMNMGMMTLLEDTSLGTAEKTFAGSVGAGLWRMCILPIDTCKSTMQVNGKDGLKQLRLKMGKHGPGVLYHGALASGVSTMVGHFPWFFTYNYLNERFPRNPDSTHTEKICRSGAIGFASSSISDVSSNMFRVIKINRQTNLQTQGYGELMREIVAKQGVVGLLTRGLSTKILSNGIQGMVFTILFDYIRRQ
jgi:hypothetical protein